MLSLRFTGLRVSHGMTWPQVAEKKNWSSSLEILWTWSKNQTKLSSSILNENFMPKLKQSHTTIFLCQMIDPTQCLWGYISFLALNMNMVTKTSKFGHFPWFLDNIFKCIMFYVTFWVRNYKFSAFLVIFGKSLAMNALMVKVFS